MRFLPAVLAAFFVFGVGAGGYAADSTPAKVKIINNDRQGVGEVMLMETPNGVLIRVNLRQNPPGITPGTHAIHIHAVGECEPPFKSAGGHFNPLNKKHGFLEKQGKHAGDLPNIHVTENAPLTAEFHVTEISLGGGKASLKGANGSALVIHQGADDYRTDPAGDSGDRVACAVIEPRKAKK